MKGQRSDVRGQRPEVRGQGPGARGQGPRVRGQGSGAGTDTRSQLFRKYSLNAQPTQLISRALWFSIFWPLVPGPWPLSIFWPLTPGPCALL
jgi:hypothetical protein